MRAAKVAGIAMMAATGAMGWWALAAPQPEVEQRADFLCVAGHVQGQPFGGCVDDCSDGISFGPAGYGNEFEIHGCIDG